MNKDIIFLEVIFSWHSQNSQFLFLKYKKFYYNTKKLSHTIILFSTNIFFIWICVYTFNFTYIF